MSQFFTRQALPNRRPSFQQPASFNNLNFVVTVGFDLNASPKEIFADGEKSGAVMSEVISDACVLISIMLQHGLTPAEIGRSLGRVPDPRDPDAASLPASPVGMLVEIIKEAVLTPKSI